MLILVRHAHAGDKKLWPFGDADRPISDQGREQSNGLEQMLGGFPIRRLLSSPYRRCRQTLGPLSERLGLPIEDLGLLARDADVEALDAFLSGPGAQGALCCTHGETLSALLRRWRGSGAVTLPAQPETTPKGASWIVEDAGAGRAAHYLAPLRVIDGGPVPQAVQQAAG